MGLSLIAGGSLRQLHLPDRRFCRPHSMGLLPGRVVAPPPATNVEALLGLSAGALRSGHVDLDWPRGSWNWDGRVLLWLGARTDAPAPLKGPPPTTVRLGSVLARLAEDDVVLEHGCILGPAGWSADFDETVLAYRLMHSRVVGYAGVAGVFSPGAAEPWQCEIYANGSFYADTPGHLARLGYHMAAVAVGAAARE